MKKTGLIAVCVCFVGCSENVVTPPATFDAGFGRDGFVGPDFSLICSACSTGCCQAGRCYLDQDTRCGVDCVDCTADAKTCVAGACVTAQTCAAACKTKNGCCTSSDVCNEKPDETACGFGGAACTPCKTGQSCDAVVGGCADPVPIKQILTLKDAKLSKGCDTLINNDCELWLLAKVLGGSFVVPIQVVAKAGTATYAQVLAVVEQSKMVGTQIEIEAWDADDFSGSDQIGICSGTVDAAAVSAGSISLSCKAGADSDALTSMKVAISNGAKGAYLVTVADFKLERNCTSVSLKDQIVSEVACYPYVEATVGSQKTKTGYKGSSNKGAVLAFNHPLFVVDGADLTKNGVAVEIKSEVGDSQTNKPEIGNCTVQVTPQALTLGEVVAACGKATANLKLFFEAL
ncbi:MAG: hypothetical protein H6707_07465 [Deltaproteobacteria bacterium]|nr:hypothetical protein [Deltaproteobacteria bacterium]